jgi:putative heme-binding domain-containing protein
MELGFSRSRDKMNLIGARPQHDTFGINNAMLIAPGDPDHSVLLQRLSRRGRGQMPPLVSNVTDQKAIELFRTWIASLPSEQKFVRDWKLADLVPKLDQLKQGRSIEAGRNAFKQIGCVQCHRLNGDGGSVGPDLTGIARRLPVRDILESVVEPSKVIAEGYATTEVETRDGDLISGRVEREDDKVLVLRPLSGEVVTLKKKDIHRRSLSKVSNMPAGIINTLTEDQILDLLAFLSSNTQTAEAKAR